MSPPHAERSYRRRAIRRKATLAAVVLALVAAIVLMILYIPSEVEQVQFVLPNGYTGPVIVTESASGAALKYVSEEHTYIVHIGQDGRLDIKDAASLRKWRTTDVRYEDGTEIPIRAISSPATNEVSWWHDYASDEAELAFFVGRQADAKAFFEKRK